MTTFSPKIDTDTLPGRKKTPNLQMEIASISLSRPETDESALPSFQLSQSNNHHRKNHRGGAKEHARRERKTSASATSADTPSSMSPASSVSGARKKNHRAGIKYKARKQAQALYGMTSAGMEPWDPLEVEDEYDSEGQDLDGKQEYEDDEEEQDERYSEPDAPSLTYDSDAHEGDHEELDSPDELFKPGEDAIQKVIGSKPILDFGEDPLAYEEVDTEAEIVPKEVRGTVEEMIVDPSPPVTAEENKVSTSKPNVVLAPPAKHDIKLLSLMWPKVL